MEYCCIFTSVITTKTNTMTTQEIYTLANEVTEQEINNVTAKFNTEENELFNTLVQLGDSKGVALFTVISKKYDSKEESEMYYNAHCL